MATILRTPCNERCCEEARRRVRFCSHRKLRNHAKACAGNSQIIILDSRSFCSPLLQQKAIAKLHDVENQYRVRRRADGAIESMLTERAAFSFFIAGAQFNKFNSSLAEPFGRSRVIIYSRFGMQHHTPD